jgi:hypothetical protein
MELVNPDQPNPFLRALNQLDTPDPVASGDPNRTPRTRVQRPLSPGSAVVSGNVAEVLGALLAPLGVSGVSERDAVEEEVASFCSELGLHAEFRSLRYGVLTLECETNVASLLEYDTGSLLERLNGSCPGQVSEVRVRTRRRR